MAQAGTKPGTDHTSGRHWRITIPARRLGKTAEPPDPAKMHQGGAWHKTEI